MKKMKIKRIHHKNCLCASCLGTKGYFKGKHNPNFKDGRASAIHLCSKCKNKITYVSKFFCYGLCRSCAKLGIKRKPFTKLHKQNISKIRTKKEGTIMYIKDDYTYIKYNGRWQAQHRVLVEKYLGRKLKPKEVVHHLNEIVADNRLSNLYVFKKRGYHSAFTNLYKNGIVPMSILKSNLKILKKYKRYS